MDTYWREQFIRRENKQSGKWSTGEPPHTHTLHLFFYYLHTTKKKNTNTWKFGCSNKNVKLVLKKNGALHNNIDWQTVKVTVQNVDPAIRLRWWYKTTTARCVDVTKRQLVTVPYMVRLSFMVLFGILKFRVVVTVTMDLVHCLFHSCCVQGLWGAGPGAGPGLPL